MPSTSQVLLLLYFSDKKLKSEEPNGGQTFIKSLSCVVIVYFGNGGQKNMNVQSQLLIFGVLPEHKTFMVAERKRVDRLVTQLAHPKVSLSRPTATGGNEIYTQNYPSEGIVLICE